MHLRIILYENDNITDRKIMSGGFRYFKIQCSSDMSEPKYTRNARRPNMRIRTYVYAYMYTHIRVYSIYAYASLVCMS